jgi:hypothetical protein
VPAEVQPLAIRSRASALTTAVRNGSSFVFTQFALPVLVRAPRASAWPRFLGPAHSQLRGRPAAVATGPLPYPLPFPVPPPAQCATRWGLFAILAGATAAGATALWLLVPETRGLALEEVHLAWRRHWLWGRWEPEEEDDEEGEEEDDEDAVEEGGAQAAGKQAAAGGAMQV